VNDLYLLTVRGALKWLPGDAYKAAVVTAHHEPEGLTLQECAQYCNMTSEQTEAALQFAIERGFLISQGDRYKAAPAARQFVADVRKLEERMSRWTHPDDLP
jgi:hypothetical protein